MRVLGLASVLAFLVAAFPPAVSSEVRVGEKAELFRTVNEDLRPVNMADLIDGRPLVLVVGSCS